MSEIVIIERALLKSEAFRALGGTAKTVYLDFLMKRRIKGVKVRGRKEPVILNNGELEYSYSEAEAKGIPRSTFMRALDELIGRGFLDVAHSGSGGMKGDKSLYSISERWRAYGTEHFVSATRSKDTRQGRGFKPGNREWMKAKSANIGVKNGNPTIAKNGNSSHVRALMDCQKWQNKKRRKNAESPISIGWSPVFAL